MADDFRINSKPVQRPVSRPAQPVVRAPQPQAQPASQAKTQPLRPPGSVGRTSQLDLASFASDHLRGLSDPLPSLPRIRAALDAPVVHTEAPSPGAAGAPVARPSLAAVSDPATFVQSAYREALGRMPSRDELQQGVSTVTGPNGRKAFAQQLVASPEFVQRAARVDAAFQAGTPTAVSVPGTSKTMQVLWPYPEGSRYGGPEKLTSPGDMNKFRDYMAPFANYFGAGTRGSQMMWTAELGAKDGLYPGSAATKQLGAIAQNLFWDVPMQQNSDESLRKQGVSPDLSSPENMVSYLQGQKDRIDGLIAQQDPAYDGPVHMQAARELRDMVDGALARAQAFVAGDRTRIEAAPTGAFGVYNSAQPIQGQPPAAFGASISADPKAAVDAADERVRQNPSLLGPNSFHARLSSYLLGS